MLPSGAPPSSGSARSPGCSGSSWPSLDLAPRSDADVAVAVDARVLPRVDECRRRLQADHGGPVEGHPGGETAAVDVGLAFLAPGAPVELLAPHAARRGGR